jgi:hypothetical protein
MFQGVSSVTYFPGGTDHIFSGTDSFFGMAHAAKKMPAMAAGII